MAKKFQLKERDTDNVVYPITVKQAVIGLENVDNTADIDKPVSTAQNAAIQSAKHTAIATANGTANNYLTEHKNNINNPHQVTKSQVGLSNVTNDAQVKRTEMGVSSGVATLDTNGKVPSSQLPSYVDDVLEFDNKDSFPTTGEEGKIYLDITNNKIYRWGGTTYIEIPLSLALGETSSTAYAGNKGKDTTDKINSHVANIDNPHEVTKDQVGLGNVDNTSDLDKPISTAVKQQLDNIGSGLNQAMQEISKRPTGDYISNQFSGFSQGLSLAHGRIDDLNESTTNQFSEVQNQFDYIRQGVADKLPVIFINKCSNYSKYGTSPNYYYSASGCFNTNKGLSENDIFVKLVDNGVNSICFVQGYLPISFVNDSSYSAASEYVNVTGIVSLGPINGTNAGGNLSGMLFGKKDDDEISNYLFKAIISHAAGHVSVRFMPINLTNINNIDLGDIINNKVDKIEGKSLSTNDYTDEDKNKLDGIGLATNNNYGLIQGYDNTMLDNGYAVQINNGLGKVIIPDATVTQKGLMSQVDKRAVNGISTFYTQEQTGNEDDTNNYNTLKSTILKIKSIRGNSRVNIPSDSASNLGVNFDDATYFNQPVVFYTDTITIGEINLATWLPVAKDKLDKLPDSFITYISTGATPNSTGVDIAWACRNPGQTIDTNAKTTIPLANTTAPGVMSSADKVKLNGIEEGAQVNTITSVNGKIGAVVVDGITTDDRTKLNNIPYTLSVASCTISSNLDGNIVSIITLDSNSISVDKLKQLLSDNKSNPKFIIEGNITLPDTFTIQELYIQGLISKNYGLLLGNPNVQQVNAVEAFIVKINGISVDNSNAIRLSYKTNAS